MKKALIGVAAAIMFAVPASANLLDTFHIQYNYFDNNGQFVGQFTVYCNGFEVMNGSYTNNYTMSYGNCDAR